MFRFMYFIGACLLFASCSKPEATPISRDLRNLPPLVATLEKRDRLVLHEGLPHPRVHRKEFAEELAAKKFVLLHDHHFYDAVIEMKAEDAARLAKLLSDPDSFRENSGRVKACNGFHPDFCAEWQVGEDVYRALICFGCSEVKVYGPASDVLCDMKNETQDALMKLLNPYHARLPKLE